MASRREVMDYIIQSSQARGIDPNIALRVFKQESGFNPSAKNVTPREASYGVAQLNIKGGLGVEARRRGIEPTDPNQWQKHVDFSLDTVKRDGWRQWMGAKDTGVGRWQGVGSRDPNPTNIRPPKSIDIGDKPQLAQLKPDKPKSQFDTAGKTTNWTLSQTAPTEQSNTMARHPGFEEAIKKSMAEKGVQYAGFVPPGLTKGAAKTRADANANVPNKAAPPKSTVPDAEKQIGRKDAPVTAEEKAALEDYNFRHEQWLNGDGPHPGPAPGRPEPRIRDATDPRSAADPRTGTALQRTDPNVSAQGDPASNAMISARIRGTARGGGQPPRLPPPAQRDLTGPTAAAAAGAVAAGTMAGTERPESKTPGATGIPPSLEHLLIQGIPTIKEAMKDPATAAATKQVVQKVISTQAARDSLKADTIKDPTYYQRMASQRSPSGAPADPSDPMYERRMMDAVARDQQGSMSRRGTPQQDPALAAVQQRVQQGPPPEVQRPRGTISIRPTPDAVRNAQPVYPQPAPGEEKGGPPPAAVAAQAPPYPTAPGAGPSPHRFQQYADAPSSQGLPTGYNAPAESVVNTGYPQGPAPTMTPQMMDPTMMQLMQFFTQGGGGGGFEGP